jgi:hypothetical protein
MSDVMSQIGTFLSSGAGKGVETGAVAGTGLLQNFFANREASNKQKFVEQLITNPAKFNQYVSGFEKPLTAGLTANVARQTDAYGAERGLSSSPAIMKDVYAQALAPLLAQQQQSGQNAALQSLGIYENSPTTKPVDISSILKALMMGQKQSAPGEGPVVDPGMGIKQPSYMPGGGPIDFPSFDPSGIGQLPQPSVDSSSVLQPGTGD